MRKVLFVFSVLMIVTVLPLAAQEVIFDFDGSTPIDSFSVDRVDDISYLKLSYDSSMVDRIGDAALLVDTKINASESWGGYTLFSITRDVGDFWDFSAYDTLSFRYYIKTAPVNNDINFLIILNDNTAEGWANGTEAEQWEYRNFNILTTNATPGWNTLNIPLVEVNGAGAGSEGSDEGFGAPYYSGGENDRKLNLNKITSLVFDFQFEGQGPLDSCQVYLDQMTLKGESDASVVFFNGRAFPSNVTASNDYGGGVEITESEFFVEPASVKWTVQGEYDALIFDLSDSRNLGLKWSKDSVKFHIKAEAGIGDIALTFYDTDTDGDATADYAFEANYTLEEAVAGFDGTWKQIAVPLSEFDRAAGVWDEGTESTIDGEMDSTKVKGFKVVATGNTAINGKVLYFDQVWTGNPVLDITPPSAPVLNVVTDNKYNLIAWTDVDGEVGETYNLYYSKLPITDVTSQDVSEVRLAVGEGVLNHTHRLRAPKTDQDVKLYYAATCADASGNVSALATFGPVTNGAKGVPVISLATPAGLVCDGDLSEWTTAGIIPVEFAPSTDTPGHAGVETDVFDNNSDFYVRGYYAIDDNYLYVAFDVDDDFFTFDSLKGEWISDNVELFIGLYDWRGLKHQALGDDDYAVGFYQSNHPSHGLRINGIQVLNTDSTDYYFGESATGWIVESRISLDKFAANGGERFHPVKGMRIAMDMSAHDSDVAGVLQGTLCYSPYNFDSSFRTPKDWTHTWIGDFWTTGVDYSGNINPSRFVLENNYPNPFNPETTIPYSLNKAGQVEMTIFNLLGQKIKVLVDKVQPAGAYKIKWNGRDDHNVSVSSGIYICRLKQNDSIKQQKLMLLK